MASSKGSAFAQGFASTFVPIYTARIQAEEKKELDTIKIGAQAWLDQEQEYKTAKQKEEELWSKAEAIVSTESAIPKNATATIFNMLKAGRSTDNIVKDVRTKGSSFKAFEAPTTSSLTQPIETVDQQTEDMLSTPGINSEAGKPINTPSEIETDTDKEDPNNPFTQYRSEIQEYLGKDDDYFNQVLGGYQAPERQRNYSFTPGASDKEREFTSPKALALYNLQNSDAYRGGTSEAQQEMLVALERRFDKPDKGSSTYTVGNFASDQIKYTSMLASDDPKEVEEATNWFTKTKPVIQSVLQSTASLNDKKDPEDSMFIQYTNENGDITNGTGIRQENGDIELDNGIVVPKDSVRSVQTVSMAEAGIKAMNSASTIFGEVDKARTNSLVGVERLYALDNIIKKNENALTTIAGAGSSMFDSFRKEMISAGELLFSLQGEDPNADAESLLSSLNEDIQEKVEGSLFKGGSITQEVADVYKEFNAALVRSVFATGKALGQSGNGFSNKDYDNIMKSLRNSNSYSTFSQNLRNFAKEMYGTWDAQATSASSNPIVQKARQYETNRELIDVSVAGVQDYFDSEGGKEKLHIYQWATSKAPARDAQKDLIESAGDAEVELGMNPDLVGKKVMRVISVDENGQKTVYFERAE